MKQTFKSLLFVLLAVIVGTTACKKDEDSASGEAALTAASCWKLSKAEGQAPGTTTWIDVTSATFDACFLDNCYKFNSDKTIDINEGATKCDPTDPQEYDGGTWSLSADGKTLTLDENGDITVGTVVELSSNKLVLEATDSGVKVRLTWSN